MRIYVAGINGMVGSSIALEAKKEGHEVLGKSSQELDFTNRPAVFNEMRQTNPDALVIAAAKVGGIAANSSLPVNFLSINLQIQTNLLDAAHEANLGRVLFLGSSCIYPKYAPQPISESSILTGELEPTNEPYAIAKIAGLKLVEAYQRQYGHNWISAMPTNLYGPRDNFSLTTSHVLPMLMHRFHIARIENADSVEIWGDGSPLREFLHVEDLAKACIFLLNQYHDSTAINIGSGQEISIMELAILIANAVGFKGEITLDNSHPNGTPRKLLNSERIRGLGWKPQITLADGISSTYNWFLTNQRKGIEI
jgi:GDP-L-fucose synthase